MRARPQTVPHGPGAVGTLLRDPVGAIFAAAADRAAREATSKLYPNKEPETDAFRHAAGIHLLTKTIGEERAKKWGDAHEVDGIDPFQVAQDLRLIHKNTEGERQMDLYNNRVARGLPRGGARQISNAITNGQLRIRPFDE